MKFHHVTVKTKLSESWSCLFKDLSKPELKKSFVKPYKLGKSIFYDGKILSSLDIIEVKINITENNLKSELAKVQDESIESIRKMNASGIPVLSLGWGYRDHEINNVGENVTSYFIDCPPGGGTYKSLAADFIKHPWVVRVLGGLTFAGVIAYLGLK